MPGQRTAGPIVELPYRVRLNIYRHAGVPTATEIHLNGSSDMLKGHQVRPTPPQLTSSHALLLTCHLFYREVTSLLFTTNLIILKPAEPVDLRLLSRLRPETVKLFRRLTVHLNSMSGLPHEPCEKTFDGYISPYVGKYATRPVSLKPEDEDLLNEWQSAITWVLKYAEPYLLSLHVVCDCKDQKTAQYVCRPIYDSDIVLADCALRLNQRRKRDLRDEARMTAQRAMSLFIPEGPFPFMQLPPELRRHVLGFTDLVTPLREVEWAPREGYHFDIIWSTCMQGRGRYCGSLHHACEYVDCYKFHQDGCFCQRYHSAYSRKCRCWLYPGPLFRVSRAFKREADAVFFQQNCFVVRSRRGFHRAAKYTPKRIAPSIFFTTLGSNLRHLRYLEIVLPPVDYDYLRYHDPAYPAWLDSIELAADKLNLPQVTLYMVMSDHDDTGTSITHFRRNMTSAQGETIIKMYFRIITPLRRLRERGLKRFFVSLAWPYRWTERGRNRKQHFIAREITELEHQVERAVMGEDYDGIAVGKKEIQRPMWTDKFWEGFDMFQHSVDNSESENDLDELVSQL